MSIDFQSNNIFWFHHCQVISTFGSLDILVSNAAVNPTVGPTLDVSYAITHTYIHTHTHIQAYTIAHTYTYIMVFCIITNNNELT